MNDERTQRRNEDTLRIAARTGAVVLRHYLSVGGSEAARRERRECLEYVRWNLRHWLDACELHRIELPETYPGVTEYCEVLANERDAIPARAAVAA